MVYNKFFLQVLTRVLLIFVACIVLGFIFGRSDLFFTQIIIGITILLQLFELVRFVNKTNIELSRFLEGIQAKDFSMHFTMDESSYSFHKLSNSFKGLTEMFKSLETEKEVQYLFLERVVNQIDVGIITINANGDINLINDSAVEILKIPRIKNWKKVNNPNFSILNDFLAISNYKNRLFEVRINNQTRVLSVSSTSTLLLNQRFTIISFKDIRPEIQTKEIEAWHRMIRILTHEVMNSVTPISSLTDTTLMLLETDSLESHKEDILEATLTIKNRSESILKFVADYRKLSKIPKPEVAQVDTRELWKPVLKLFETDCITHQIELITSEEYTKVNLDSTLIQQVLINLIKNSIESLAFSLKPRKIEIETTSNASSIILSVSDNGAGISAEKIDRVFIPFYTTKKEGSGIGLAFSRQIMNLHGGAIELSSTPNIKTTFSLIFPT